MVLRIDAQAMEYRELNRQIRQAEDTDIIIEHCLGQRYIASGLSGKKISVYGTPGNALGAYLDGCSIIVQGNAQDALGDTMNDGTIIVHGSVGDAAGYAMRGGKIFVKNGAGYRAGIHMKQYQDKVPVLVIGGSAGSFLGEYQAGGNIIVLGLDKPGQIPVGNFCGTGMHGGRIYLRCSHVPHDLPDQVEARLVQETDMEAITPVLREYCAAFGLVYADILQHPFFVLTPNTKNPYRQLYTAN